MKIFCVKREREFKKRLGVVWSEAVIDLYVMTGGRNRDYEENN